MFLLTLTLRHFVQEILLQHTNHYNSYKNKQAQLNLLTRGKNKLQSFSSYAALYICGHSLVID